jgi:glycosyltransferase involved in cell wall biosynthesis
VIEIINNGESLTKCYNRGLEQAKYDIVVFCHDDLTIETKQWGNKLIKMYDNNQEYGIIGVAGTKHMAESGMWWEKRKKMYGRVKHTSGGRSWLNTYSADIGTDLEEVVVVDGVFFSCHKKRIKSNFDENVEGFHFYDISFAFQNYLAGVKVGVQTQIRINHQSIGETNEQWDENRKIFAEKYVDKLPVNIKKEFRKGEKIRVLIGCLNFANYTGSELYVYELAKELIKQGCDVSVCSKLGDPIARKAHAHGIKLYNIEEPPGYKLGDGKWQVNTQNGPSPSANNHLYKVEDVQFDVLHLNHKPITEHLLRLYPDTDTICSIHSEVIELEHPVINPQIKKYIAIRPEIKEFLINRFDISEDMIDVVYNPIDYKRFKPVKVNNEKPIVLFVGTLDYLREQTLQDLISTTKAEGKNLWIVGKENGILASDLIGDNDHVTYHGPSSKVETFVKQCDETAGILLGRTTIEGWLCGKVGWIYDVDSSGNIISKKLHEVPTDIDKFRADKVAQEIIEEYKEIVE